MNWQEALEEIQSVEFDANLNVVSGTNSFFRAVAQEPAVIEAYQELRNSGELREEILGRIYDLAVQEIDPRYANPNDTPLAVFLWLTYFGAGDLARIAADRVDHAPQCWYASKLAKRILNPPPSKTEGYWIGEVPDGSNFTSVSFSDMKDIIGFTTDKPLKVYFAKPGASSATTVPTIKMSGGIRAVATD